MLFSSLLATCRPEEAAAARAGGSRRCRRWTTPTGEGGIQQIPEIDLWPGFLFAISIRAALMCACVDDVYPQVRRGERRRDRLGQPRLRPHPDGLHVRDAVRAGGPRRLPPRRAMPLRQHRAQSFLRRPQLRPGPVRGDEGVPAAGPRRVHAVPAGGERAADAERRRAHVHAGAVRRPVRPRRQGDRPRQQALGTCVPSFHADARRAAPGPAATD